MFENSYETNYYQIEEIRNYLWIDDKIMSKLTHTKFEHS